jgi:hypothetical protein
MAGGSLLTLRIDADLKKRIAAAAARRGKSITTFVLEAATSEVNVVESEPSARAIERGPLPTFFVALCTTAAAGGRGGSYVEAAQELTRHLRDLCPYEIEGGEWNERVDVLVEAVTNGATDEVILDWFDQSLPRCMALVPRRRRDKFAERVRGFLENHDI